MKLLQSIAVIIALTIAINLANATELSTVNKLDKNLKPYILDAKTYSKMVNNYDKFMEDTPIEFFVLDSLANAYSFYTNEQSPFVYDVESSTLVMIKRGFSEDDNGTDDDPDNTKNNLFVRSSEDWGQEWSDPIIVYNKKDNNLGDARYPTVDPFMFEGELSYTFITPVTGGEGWDGFVNGLYIPAYGTTINLKTEKFDKDGIDYYWTSTSTKLIADVYGDGHEFAGEPFALAYSTPAPEIDDRNGDNQSALGMMTPNASFSEWMGYVPPQWDSQNFRVVTEEQKIQYPPGDVNDYREFRFSSISELEYLEDGVIVASATGLFVDGNPTEKLTGGVSISEDYGETWSEYNICDFSVIQDYASANGVLKLDSISTSYDMVFFAKDKDTYSFITTLYENDVNKDDEDLIRELVELYYEDGAWGVRKVADITGYIIVYPSSDPTQQPRNQMGIELQVSLTVDKSAAIVKFVDFLDVIDPDTGQLIERGQHDVFVVKRELNNSEWSKVKNVTNTPAYDRITWIPDKLPNNLESIPLLRMYTIPVEGQTDEEAANWQRELEEPQYVLIGYFDASGVLSVNETKKDGNIYISNIFPNPANDNVTLNFNLPESGKTNVQIFDLLGNPVLDVYNGILSGGFRQLQFDVSDLANGTYYCTVTFEGKKVSKVINVIK